MNTSLDRQASAVPHDDARWSILIPTYNPSELLRDAIASAQTSIAVSGRWRNSRSSMMRHRKSSWFLVRSWAFHSSRSIDGTNGGRALAGTIASPVREES
jgi:hypothetical protein